MMHVHIGHDRMSQVMDITVFYKEDRAYRILQVVDGRMEWNEVRENEAVQADTPPTVQLPHEAGRVLLDELIRYFHGSEDTRALRRDYDAERKRVDDQARVIASIAQTLATRSV